MGDSKRTKAELREALTEAEAKIAKLEEDHLACKRAMAVARRRAAQVSLIYEVGQRISGELTLDALVVEVVEAVAEAFGFRGVLLFLHDPKTHTLSLAASAGELAPFFDPDFQLKIGEGLIGLAAETGETQISGDVAPDDLVRQIAGQVRSEMATPIKSGSHVVGVLDVQSDDLEAFDDSYRLAIEALAVQAAPAIEHARSFEEAQSRAERLAVVNRIAKIATATLDLDHLMESVYDEVSQAFQADAFFIALYDEEAEEIDLCFEIDEGERHDSGRFPLGTGLTSIIITERRPLIIRNMAEQPDYDEQGVAWGSGRTPASWLGVPLMLGEQVMGVLSVQAYRPYAWGEDDERLLLTIADQVAVAIEKASLFQEREQRMTELSVLNEIGQVISSAMRMDDLMETVYEQVTRLFETKNFYIATYDRVSDMWEIVYLVEEEEVLPPGGPRELGAGVTGFIIRNRQPVLFQSRAEYVSFHEKQGQKIEAWGEMPRAWMGAPLVVADETVGVMGIQDLWEEGVYDEQDLALFIMIAAQVAPALGNLRLLEKAQRRAQEMAVINEVGRAITSVLDLSTVLRQIVDITKERFNYYCVSILLVEEEHLVFRSGSVIGDTDRRFWPEVKDVDIFEETSMVTQVARTGEPALANDVTQSPHFLENEDLSETRSELTLPIKVKDETIGVLDVQSTQVNAYRPSDVELLQALANQAGVAIQNARLFEDAHIRAEELAVLNELGRSLTAQLDVQEVLQEAYWQTSRLIDTTNFFIVLYDVEQHTLSFALSISEIDEDLPTSFSADAGLTGYVVRQRAPLLLEETLAEETEKLGISEVGVPSLSWLGVPLIASERVIGIINIESPQVDAFSEDEVRLLNTLASNLAVF
ncbi:MAG TPA: GAF domain-containing protein, partial [Chloroflexi bacterium]|nr:GAF domain-containing protein [Chloroflexota bacterium]